MGNCSNGGNGCIGCCLMNSLAEIFSNLFSTEPYCGGNGGNFGHGPFGRGQNGFGPMPVSGGVPFGNGGSGYGCGCGSNGDLSYFTACDNQCYDAYYAQQYALGGDYGCGCGSGGY